MTSAAHLGLASLLTLGASAATTDPAAAFSHYTAPTSTATPAATGATTAGSTTASPTARSGQPQAPTSNDSLTKTAAMIMIGVGAPLALGLLVTITIWGYMLGRRHESAEMDEQRKERERRERRRRRAPATVRYELEGKEVLEMGTRANCAEMDDDQRPPVEMEGLREPAELPAGSWVKLLGTLR
ncbi:uncharacterized protein LTHEOB_5590 [Lasiodiplodia theobromae]|uniref:uncharacterized protein n=1 Tax=Lasiodiplodia theobromae TaxID=45133 RepID=UPI0015C32DDA|nr:uncharacterized protein LTHEOB_5590 [Lasiodiplodia theobromae]KAF4545179.1 hypothetical protein LTHEOB_5590 [Lasiodiplodia theobromae]